jgi:hypothetical protein
MYAFCILLKQPFPNVRKSYQTTKAHAFKMLGAEKSPTGGLDDLLGNLKMVVGEGFEPS